MKLNKLLLIAICLSILCSCDKQGRRAPDEFLPETEKNATLEAIDIKSRELIDGYNSGMYGKGRVFRDTDTSQPDIAWRRSYGVMDEKYSYTYESEHATALLRVTYSEYISTESAKSWNEAEMLSTYELYDSYVAEVTLEYIGGSWEVTACSVYSQKDKEWTDSNLFMDGMPIT